MTPDTGAGRVVRGLEAIIDAAAGVLAEQSLDATLQSMARALHGIVPFTSLAVYELDASGTMLQAVFACGRYVEETLASPAPVEDSIAGKVVQSRQLVHLEPGHPWLHVHQIPGTPADDEALVFAPLITGDRVIGTLNVWREDVAPTFSPEEAQLIKRFATLAAMAYDNARQRELLRTQARTDHLTGLFNRRHFHERLGAELARHARDGEAVGLLLLDLDDFKQVNDRHGHPVGDEVLVAVARILLDQIRGGDVVCRTGGEEFAVILPSADGDEAVRCAERLLAGVRATDFGLAGRRTISIGVATAAADGTTVGDLFSAADARLLAAKAQGKDRAVAGATAVAGAP